MTIEELSEALTTARIFAGDVGPIGALADAYIALYERRFAVGSPLTKRQREVYDYLSSYIDEHGYAPTFGEIATQFGYRAYATVHEHLTNLERKGWIRRGFNSARGIEIVEGSA